MTTSRFPNDIDTTDSVPSNITANDLLFDRHHHDIHNIVNDAVVKIETVLGVGWSLTSTDSVRTRLASLDSASASHTKNIADLQTALAAAVKRLEVLEAGVSITTGLVYAYAGIIVPAGYLECDGKTYLRETYPALWTSLEGTNWGTRTATTFTTPDLREATLIGTKEAVAQLAVGSFVGANSQVISVPMLPAHAHDMNHRHVGTTADAGISPMFSADNSGGAQSIRRGATSSAKAEWLNDSAHAHSFTTQGPIEVSSGNARTTTGSVGGGQAMDMRQRSAAVKFIIKT